MYMDDGSIVAGWIIVYRDDHGDERVLDARIYRCRASACRAYARAMSEWEERAADCMKTMSRGASYIIRPVYWKTRYDTQL